MVAHRRAPRRWQLRGTDVHATVELHGVGVHDFAGDVFSYVQCQRRLAGAGRADDRDGPHCVDTRAVCPPSWWEVPLLLLPTGRHTPTK